jgi:hypothetical protein
VLPTTTQIFKILVDVVLLGQGHGLEEPNHRVTSRTDRAEIGGAWLALVQLAADGAFPIASWRFIAWGE